jgi:hypothetical protein
MTDDLLYRLRGVMCGDDPVIEEAASRIEELEKYQSIHSQCDKSSLEVEGKLVQRLSLAHARIKNLEAALREIIGTDELSFVPPTLRNVARKALEGKDD